MKALSSVILLLTVSATLHAQRFSIGARTGIGYWSGYEYDGEFGPEKPKPIWEKEVFVRFIVGKYFAFEAGGFEQHGRKIKDYENPVEPYYFLHQEWKYAFYGLNLRLQFLTGNERPRGLHNYFGIVVAPSLETAHNTRVIYSGPGETITFINDNRYKGWQAGIEDMIQYRLNQSIAFHLLISYRGRMFSSKGYADALSSPDAYAGEGYQAQLGAAYTFLKKQKPPMTAP